MKSCSASLNELKPSPKDMGCIPQADGEFVARMEDVFDLYAEKPDQRLVVCFDESPTELIDEVRRAIPAKAGQLEHYDCEYKRNSTVNLFILSSTAAPRSASPPACASLANRHFSRAERIRAVLDNMATHSVGALYLPPEARRLLCRLQFHYVPKHANWLSMVEIEIGVLRSQCLDRRIQCTQRIVSEVAAWERQRNASRCPHQMDVHK